MMARCTGKTNLHNLEPEDLRALTLPTAGTTDILPVGKHEQPSSAWGMVSEIQRLAHGRVSMIQKTSVGNTTEAMDGMVLTGRAP